MQTLHLGHLHLPLNGLFLAAALIAALLLTQRTAPLALVPKQAMWDATLFAAITAFLISRLLLIALYFKSFVAHPILLLTLPSLTVSGLLLTSIVLVLYLRRRKLPIAKVVDAAASPLSLLWAILSLGAALNGSNDGLPTTLPWAIRDPLYGHIHPVELYLAFAFLALTVLLYRALALVARPGTTAATGLFLAGAAVFLLDFFAQPSVAERIVFIDPAQWLALAMLLLGFFTLLPRLQSN